MHALIQRRIKLGHRILGFLVENVSLGWYFTAFVFVVIGWACIYSLLTPYQNGLSLGPQAMFKGTFWDSLYFSVVTVSSLGYGDIHPIGISRLFACMEVLLGLTIMGIVLAKVTSRRLYHYIQRLFSSDAQKKIERFAVDFTNSADDLQQAMTILSETYQATPGQGSVPRGDTLGARSSFKKAISTLHTVTSTLHEYISYETEQGAYFAIIPMDAFLQLGNSIDKDMLILGQLIISLSPKARIDVFLEQDIRQQISKIVDKQRITCQFVEKHCQDETVKNCFFQIRKTCDGVPESYFVTPIISVEKPDQLPKRGDEPQIPSASPQDET